MADKGFMFYEGYYKATKNMSEAETIEFYKGLIEYAFTKEEIKSRSKLVDIAFTMAKPSIDKSLKNRENGINGSEEKKKLQEGREQ